MDERWWKLRVVLTDFTRPQGIELTLDQTKMTDDEKRANLSINRHVADNPI